MDQRGQFTFYASIFEAARRIRNKAARADFYDAVCDYALNGIEPPLDKLSDAAAIGFISAKPNLDSSRRKATSGKAGGSVKQSASKPEANGKQMVSKAEANAKQTGSEKEKEKEEEKEKEKEYECIKGGGEESNAEAFDLFWNAYPNKQNYDTAKIAFDKVTVPVATLLEALDRQKKSYLWERENGQYIPLPENWLARGKWRDELPAKGNQGGLGAAEMEAIQRVLAE